MKNGRQLELKISDPGEVRDLKAAEQLRLAGDLTRALRSVRHHVELPNGRHVVASMKLECERLGYHMEVSEAVAMANGTEKWRMLLSLRQAVDVNSVQRHSRVLSELARRHGGQYEGWQCEPVFPADLEDK